MFSAIRSTEGEPSLCVHGSILVYTEETEVALARANPQGINPSILLLNLTITPKPGPMKGVPRLVHYDESGDSINSYSQVQIVSNQGDVFIVDIKDTSLLQTLPGRPFRVYASGSAITQDFIENRFNVETSDGGETIVSVWFG